ncbi:MAG TPA: hypothetical protein VGD88_06230 [Opitutaceae bacterium]
MSPDQIRKYRVHVAQWQAARKEAGKPHDDAARYELHRRCTGRACSSTAFTNAELDKVLQAMMAEIDPAGFDEQMRLQESPELRIEDYRCRCHDAVAAIVGDDVAHRRNYLAAIVRQVSYGKATALDKISERQTQQVMGILERRVRQIEKDARKIANTSPATEPAPF